MNKDKTNDERTKDAHLSSIVHRPSSVGSVMVVGAGIAGIQASLDLADSGYKVYLVESGTAIGGHMAQLDKTFPTNDCSMCTISPRLVAAGTHRNIEMITNAELAELAGEAGNFKARVAVKPHFVDLEKCTGCGVCAEECPVSLPDEYNQLLGDRKAIFKEYPQAVPNKFAMTRIGVAPCHDSCPIYGNPSGYVALAAAGKYAEAYVSATETNPFPSICGRICEHPCEQVCNRANLDSPVSIAYVKRFLADWYDEHGEKLTPEQKQESIVENGRKVAVIGSGPAGLSAALELRKMGYGVTVFEKHGVLGGMMRIGIPEYRLPTEIIERDIQNILDYGIDVKLNTNIQGQSDIEAMFDVNYDAVFLSVGSHKSVRMGMEGEDSENSSSGIAFLRDVRLGKRKSVKKNVIVIGGGNVAMDCARTALRLGGEKVSIVCLEGRDRMPAYPWEIEWAEEEGVAIRAAKATKKIIVKDGTFTGLELLDVKKMAFVEGRLELETVPGTKEVLAGDELIVAIGQKPDLGLLGECGKIKLTKRGTVEVDEKTGMTSWKGVFVGGDVIRGAASVVQATADGQLAAGAIDAYIRGEKFEPEKYDQPVVEISTEELKERKEKVIERHEMPTIPIDRRRSFEEVDLGFTEEMAKAEAQRCLYCAVCSWCGLCEKVCEADAIRFDDTPKERSLDIGAVILSPGFDLYDAEKKAEYGYRRFANVVSSMDYERILSASGPFEGHIQRLSDGAKPKKIAFIQCVGSRDNDNPYCSSVCCMYATKQAIITKEHLPDAACKVFVMDVRAFSKGFDEYYERAKDKYGVEYVYTRPSNIKQNFKTGNLSLESTDDGKNWEEEEFDMVILSSGLCASEYSQKLADVCSIELNEYDFAKSAEFAPTASSREGVFLAGAFESPKDIPESVVQASGAAARAMELLADVRGTQVKDKEYPLEKDFAEQEARIGVFVCHCGSNIGGVIDCQNIANYASALPNVVFSTNLMYSCSPDGLKAIKDSIEEHTLNKVVVASCTPRTHEPLFRETMKEAGLNPYLFEMANIRDQCTWVHARLGEVTKDKAIDLVKMAVGRARTIESLTTQSYVPKRNLLVVGGGVAGMTAALSVANQGFDVYLVEKTDRLGGSARQVKETVEGYKPQELLDDLERQIESNDRITVCKNSQVAECKGFIGDFKSKLVCDGKELEIEHGAAIIATGASESRPTEYLYSRNDKVLTQLELEERLDKDPEFARRLSEVVMIQCVGSREPERMICSRICCTEAIKNAMTIKRVNPKATVAILYRDVRTYGFKEKYYNKAREMGVLFFRYDLDNKPVVTQDASGRLEVRAKDLNSTLDLSFSPEILTLSAAMIPPEDCESVSTAFKVPLNLECFFLEAHMKLRPVDFASEGLFLCGACHSPKFIDETVTQAKATAAKAVSILSRKQMEISGVVSVVDPDKCAACLTCVRTCPYDVPTINAEGAAEIEAAMCHGCGICASECPAKAIQLMHYKDNQIISKTTALFQEAGKVLENE
ncbi:MAG: 4Fe-4S ferredoxin [Planctomycetes bacterium B3_Pla]|nr:MAG: 4Fe-4S ferredoxin [Planctomycetes bacterium B3_Pla]